jgi:hypothetical protein
LGEGYFNLDDFLPPRGVKRFKWGLLRVINEAFQVITPPLSAGLGGFDEVFRNIPPNMPPKDN